MIKLGIYKHYKGKNYQVIGIATHEETHEELVIYQSLYGEYKLWARNTSVFTEEVFYNGDKVKRFEFLS